MGHSGPEGHETAPNSTEQAGGEQSRQETGTSCGPDEPQEDGRGSWVSCREIEKRYPRKIGRFSIKRCLGAGSFGEVLLAHDEELDRPVALKFPRFGRLASRANLDGYIREARNAARLKHPGIVSVYDVRSEGDWFFIVMEYVQGVDLAEVLRLERLPPLRCTEIMIEAADAVSYAHEQGLVHRDLKPGNILVDSQGHPHIADFGLAVQENGLRLLRGQVAGTPCYMSPEQVRGETHRLDGRTDVWSLGVVLYEMLTGQRPFSGKISRDILDEIQHREARPPRQLDRNVPQPLERICLKCLSKRMVDRYPSASDLVDDLCDWRQSVLPASPAPADAPGAGVLPAGPSPSSIVEAKKPVRVIPKGLRSFDADDADFFLELLPGPFDREGLPEPIRFWKTRIEETDADKTFPVGLLYGPSGCGKSSLVKAGLLPRLAGHVHPVYVEATSEETEGRLARGLRRACPGLPEDDSLVGLLLAIREGNVLQPGTKVLVVLDQFEQWLYARRPQTECELIRALRHCDGQSAQCLLLVRDGFGMSAMRLMNALEIPVVEGVNYATVDRFDPGHAVKVLAHFGRAFGRLPEDGSLAAEQERFLQQAVEGLTEDGQVVSVRLAVFADMFRGKAWDPVSLKRVGGAEGIGVTFLEEALGAGAANPAHRLHERAARRVLHALLPEHGANIRGHMLSERELVEISGYANRPRDFEELVRILDNELRLIMPSDPDQPSDEDGLPDRPAKADSTGTRFQLTHDYVVAPLREWLTRKLRETMRGRASLLLESRAELFGTRPERRYLPSLVEWATIGLMTKKSQWKEPERKMMRWATRLYAVKLSVFAVLAAVVLAAGYVVKARMDEHRNRCLDLTDSLVSELFVADWERVPEILDELKPYGPLWRDQLERAAHDPSRSADQRTRADLALGLNDLAHRRPLIGALLEADAEGARYRALFNVLSGRPDEVMESARRTLGTVLPKGSSQAEIERLAKSKASAAVMLTRLGQSEVLWPLFEASEDPQLRTLLIHRLYPYGVDGKKLIPRLTIEQDPSIKQAILLALGTYGSDGLGPNDRERVVTECLSLYRSDPGAAVHSAAEWLLRIWGHEETLEATRAQLAASHSPAEETAKMADVKRAGLRHGPWYVNGQGHTMMVLRMQAPDVGEGPDSAAASGDGPDGRIFAVSAHEVTIEQFLRFRPDARYSQDVSPHAQCPINMVEWFDAAKYCRWLSEQEGVPEEQMCYPATGKIQPGMSVPDDFLRRTGYRLPTEAEWEFACRAGTSTDRFFGRTDQMLPEYAWYDRNSEGHLWPVGALKPNPWGLFDMYGNVMEWCQRALIAGPAGRAGSAVPDGAQGGTSMGPSVARGGAYRYPSGDAVSTHRHPFTPNDRTSFIGFRIARTIRP